jgi:hypothetical protein
MIFRSFRGVETRLLLERQDELRVLEQRISEQDYADLDKELWVDLPRRLSTRHRDDLGERQTRQQLMDEVEGKYKAYCKRFGESLGPPHTDIRRS